MYLVHATNLEKKIRLVAGTVYGVFRSISDKIIYSFKAFLFKTSII
jgi:hypothetical protein